MASQRKEPPSKRQRTTTEPPDICVVHIDGLQYGTLKLFSTVEDADNRLAKLQDIRSKRLAEPPESVHRMEAACILIPDILQAHHGYHQSCYHRFTMNLSRLQMQQNPPEACGSRTTRRYSKDQIIFKPDCIFCDSENRKKVKSRGSWTTEGMSAFQKDGWKTILNMAEAKQDGKLLTRIRGQDLFACEAKYHQSCRTKYLQNPIKWRSANEDEKQKQESMEMAHTKAYRVVCQVIDQDVIHDKKIIKLSDLCGTYVSTLQTTDYPNPNYRGENLKSKLQKHEKYSDRLSFCCLGSFKTCIVYNNDISMNTAMTCAYELGSRDMIEEAGTHLRKEILNGFKECDELKWPPTAQDLRDAESVLPPQLQKFLCYVLSGKSKPNTAKMERLVESIGQDICRAATNCEWKLPKHMLLCLSLRHLFRSEQLITLLNRLGHSENYSFSLELETAIAEAAEEASSVLSNQIVRDPTTPSVFHSEFDNFDQLINDLTGKGSIHTAHGIMMQEVDGDGGTVPEANTVPRTGKRSLNLLQKELPECYVTLRNSPSMNIQQLAYPEGVGALSDSAKRQLVWVLARLISQSDQKVSSWAGFISQTGTIPAKLTTIDYYPVIPKPITDYKTIQECLRYAEQATAEVKQEYVITTFDLGVCMKAYPLIWNNAVEFEKHIILIGTFHLICAYLKMVGKKMRGSGLSDILLEAGLIASGSLEGVLQGKHYVRALHCHKVMLECLERLLIEQYLLQRGDEQIVDSLPADTQRKLDELVASPGKDTLKEATADEALSKVIEEYLKFHSEVRQGKLGKTAQLWLSYMDHIRMVLSLLEAVKTNNFFLYAHTLHLLADLFFSFGGQNYARYLTFFSTFMANIETSHPGATNLIKRGAMSVARSFIPGNRCAVDKTMEETFMRHAKSHGGAVGLLTNYHAYQRWVRSTHARSQYVNATLQMANMTSNTTDDSNHRDTRPAEIKKSEKCVKKAQEAVKSFLNPFDIETKDKLVILSSGAAASAEVTKDVLRAEEAGKEAKDEFVESRLKTSTNFFQPVKRLNLKTLADMNKKVKMTTSKNKVLQYKQQGNVAFQLFVKSQNQNLQLDMKELMKYPLTPVPYSIGTADGFLAKTDKSKSFHHLTKEQADANVPNPKQTLVIHDGNAYFYYLKEVPSNFSQICKKIFAMMSKGDAVFSTDSYQERSIKSMERQRRGNTEKLIIRGESTKKPPDWKAFLANDANKKQFIALICKEWAKDDYASNLQGREVTLICEGTAYLLTSEDGFTTRKTMIDSLTSTQEETDSRVILYCKYAQRKEYSYVRIKSPDSDIFFILLHHASSFPTLTILFDTGTGNRQRLLNITELANTLTPTFCTTLLALHAYTGCDTTSAFRGLGKIKPLKALQRNPQHAAALAKLGDDWTVSEDLDKQLESFTCAMYGRNKVSDVNTVRHTRINELCAKEERVTPSKNVDMGSLPPCKNSLLQHIRRVNYQVGIWKQAHVPNALIPDPVGHGWHVVDGQMEPLWFDGDVLPQQLADISECNTSDSDETDDESDVDEPLPDTLDSDSDDDD